VTTSRAARGAPGLMLLLLCAGPVVSRIEHILHVELGPQVTVEREEERRIDRVKSGSVTVLSIAAYILS
jgi:hypothetical protein